MHDHDHDVIVVGAGPAGAVAAHQLAVRGCRILLLEKAPAFPRDRACAGVITDLLVKRLARLDLALPESLVLTKISRCVFGIAGGASVESDLPGDGLAAVRRRRLDHFLVEAAVRAGARLELGWKVEAVEPVESGGWRVRSDRDSLTCGNLVLATGLRDPLPAAVGIPTPAGGVGVAVEVDASKAPTSSRDLLIELGSIPRGFFWICPAGRRLSVGLISSEVRVPGSRRLLHNFLERHGLASAGILSNTTDLLPGFLPARRPWKKGLVLIGDLMPAVDPLTGLGVEGAVRSGVWAAEAVHAALENGGPDPAEAVERRRRRMLREYRVAAWIASILHRSPARFLEGFRAHPVRARELALSMLGYRAYRGLTRPVIPTAFERFLRRVGRR